MKFSEAMLKGYEMVEGRQCHGAMYEGDNPCAPDAVCVIGAAYLAEFGSAAQFGLFTDARESFRQAWGIAPEFINDTDGLPWEHIYGMAVAAGL